MDPQESQDVCLFGCVRVFYVFCLRKVRDKKGETPHFLSPPPPSLFQSVLPVRRWWWRLGSSKTSGVSQAAWWAVLGWRESWMAVQYCWCRCDLGSALDSAAYCFPQCWMCWMQGFHVFCTTQTTTSGCFKNTLNCCDASNNDCNSHSQMNRTCPTKMQLKLLKAHLVEWQQK